MEHKNDTQFNAKLWGKQKFGFRKLSIGLAAVALGTTFLMSNGQLVRADETNSNKSPSTQTEQTNSSSQKDTQVANAGAEAANKAADSLAKADDSANKQADSVNSGANAENSSTQKNSTSADTASGNTASTKDSGATDATNAAKGATSDANSIKNGNTATDENKDANSKGSADNNVAGSTKAVSGANSQSNSDSSAKAEPKTVAQPKNASATNNTDKNSTTLDVKGLLNGNSKLSAEELSENKGVTTPTYDVTVKALQHTSSDPNSPTTDVTGGTVNPMVANQDSIEVDTTINITHGIPISENNPLKITINGNQANLLKIGASTGDIEGNWHIKRDGDTFDAWYDGTQRPQKLTFKANIQGNDSELKNLTTPYTSPITVTVTDPNGTTHPAQTAFTATFTRYKDKVSNNELLKGFRLGDPTTMDAEHKTWHNISDDDANKATHWANVHDGGSYNGQVLQWGMYLNYGNDSNPHLSPLQDAEFTALFNGQYVCPSSIKVFRVPAAWVVDKNGNRIGEDDLVPGTNEKVYNTITGNSAKYEDHNLEEYLRKCITTSHDGESNIDVPTGFHVDQTGKGDFYSINDNGTKTDETQNSDPDLKDCAYFIQVDTVTPNPKPGNNVWYWTKDQKFNGQGSTPFSPKSYYDPTIASSGSSTQDKTVDVSNTVKVTETIHYIDEKDGTQIWQQDNNGTDKKGLNFADDYNVDEETGKITTIDGNTTLGTVNLTNGNVTDAHGNIIAKVDLTTFKLIDGWISSNPNGDSYKFGHVKNPTAASDPSHFLGYVVDINAINGSTIKLGNGGHQDTRDFNTQSFDTYADFDGNKDYASNDGHDQPTIDDTYVHKFTYDNNHVGLLRSLT